MNKKGISLLYVMIAMIAAGFIMSSLVNASSKNSMSSIQYSKSEQARLSALAGFDKSRTILESLNAEEQKKLLSMLQEWVDNGDASKVSEKSRWLVGGQNSYDSISSDSKFKTELLAFDIDNFNVTLRSQGVDRSGNKATALGIYNLKNLDVSESKIGTAPTNALHIGSGSDRIFTNLKVHGDTYFRGNGIMLPHNVQPSYFYGAFRTEPRTGFPNDTFHIHAPRFHGPAYFNSHVLVRAHVDMTSAAEAFPVAKKGLGIEKSLSMETFFIWPSTYYPLSLNILEGNLYLNGSLEYVDDVTHHAYVPTFVPSDLNNNGDFIRYTSANVNPDHVVQYKSESIRNSKIDIPNELGIVKKVPKFDIVIEKLRPYAISVKPDQWNGADMTALYKTSTKYNDEWLVLKYTGKGSGQPFQVGGTGFEGKVLWIVENVNILSNSTMYEHTDKGLSLIYVGTGGSFSGLGGMGKFRGYIYSESDEENVLFRTRPNSTFYGGIYIKENTASFTLEGPPFDPTMFTSATDPAWIAYNKAASLTVYYDAKVMEELADLGVLHESETDEVDDGSIELIIKEGATNIETVQLSRSF